MTIETLRLLEFDKILQKITEFAHSPATQANLLATAPLGSRLEIERRFGLIEEIRTIGRSGITLPLAAFDDISTLLGLARPEGAVLNPLEMATLIPLLRIATALRRQFAYRSDSPLLTGLTAEVTGCPEILEPLELSIAQDGTLLDTASPLLYELRGRQRHLIARVRKRLEEIVREREIALFLQDDFITQRNGRWVIPVRMDAKGMVPGVVHDISNSGETAFMEPLEIIGLANELENLTADERAEQIRILRELTGWIREDADQLQKEFAVVAQLDFLNAITSFAELTNAAIPALTGELMLDIVQGRHPLLVLMQLEQNGKPVVPLDISLGGATQEQVLLITGPNTGGKTIAIKTAGLLLLMAQSGIPVPADGASTFPATAKLLADIGDEQSIEESLSTFSAHIKKISRIIAKADEQTVILLDELGTGTDPAQGAALSCGILAELQARGSLVLATTHLTDIVAFVHRTRGMLNSAMEFDSRTMAPAYRLTTGEPGQSHTFDIARRCGLSEPLLKAAEGFCGRLESEFYQLLAELREKRQQCELRLIDICLREKALASREAAVAALQAEAGEQQREARRKSLVEAKELIRSTRRELNLILDEARRDKSRSSLAKITVIEKKTEADLAELTLRPIIAAESIKAGDRLFATSLGIDVTVLSLSGRGERLRVRAGNLDIEIPVTAVTLPIGTKAAVPKKRVEHSVVREELADSDGSQLLLIGRRSEEALQLLDKFLDQAALAGTENVRIIHGKGEGILLRSIRECLASHPLVEEFRAGKDIEGGEGVTFARLK